MSVSDFTFFTEIPEKPQTDFIYLLYFQKTAANILLYDHAQELSPGDVLLLSGRLAQSLFAPPPISISPGKSVFFCLACRLEHISESVGALLLEQNAISRFLVQAANVYHYEDYLGIRTKNDPVVSTLLKELQKESAHPDSFSSFAMSHLFSLLILRLIRAHSNDCFRNVAAPFSEEGYQIMENIINSDFRLTLEDIARIHHISPAYASRYVKKATGMAFSEILGSARDHVACLMLSTTPKSIRAIAEQVGYENPENFVRAFKKTHGCTPSEYRLRS